MHTIKIATIHKTVYAIEFDTKKMPAISEELSFDIAEAMSKIGNQVKYDRSKWVTTLNLIAVANYLSYCQSECRSKLLSQAASEWVELHILGKLSQLWLVPMAEGRIDSSALMELIDQKKREFPAWKV